MSISCCNALKTSEELSLYEVNQAGKTLLDTPVESKNQELMIKLIGFQARISKSFRNSSILIEAHINYLKTAYKKYSSSDQNKIKKILVSTKIRQS